MIPHDPAPAVIPEVPVGVAEVAESQSRAAKAALRVLQVGAIAVVLAAVTTRGYDLDRFYIPKEVVLHLTAAVAGLLAVGPFRRVPLTRVDALLIGYLLVSAASSALAEDVELAMRATAISVSGVAIFWAARALTEANLGRPLVRGLALAVVVAIVTSLLQAYGIETDIFTTNRAPGGTLGNRNSIAHLAAFGIPVILLAALRAWRAAGYLLGALGVMTAMTALVLTRSRAGWLAFAAAMAVLLAGMLISRPLRRHGRTWARLAGIVLLIGAAVAAAVLVPNSLEWRSENPYLETVAGLANYQEGSGRGRLVQYGRTLRIALDEPLLGVGPGNWPLAYPDYAPADDPSMSRAQPGQTANPWPSSDWVAFAAERGFPGLILFGLAVFGIAVSGVRRLLGARDEEEAMVAAALVATLAAAVVAGLFDAVLLLAHPTLIVWAAAGALWPARRPAEERSRGLLGSALLAAVAILAGVGAARSILLLLAM